MRPREWRLAAGSSIVSFACLSLAACQLSSAAADGSAQVMARRAAATDPRLAGSYRFDKNGWIFVHLEGDPSRLGFQHGFHLATETEELLRVVKPFLLETTKKDWDFYRTAGEKILWPKVDAEYRQEIDGIVEGLALQGVRTDRWDIVALNGIEELPDYYLPWLEKQEGRTPTTHSPGNCSAFIATGGHTTDGRIVMGHNNWTDYVKGSRWNIIFDLVPARGYRMFMDGLPGVIVSDDDFGVNSQGMMITETTITGFEHFDPAGAPEFVRARRAMQYSGSIDDYVRIMLEANNGGYANDWLLGDNKTGEIALFELGLKEHSVRRTRDGYFVGSNFPVDSKLIKNETSFDANKRDSSPNARRARWEQLMAKHKGKIDLEMARQMEADAYDVIEKQNGANERTLCGAVDNSPRGVPEWDWPPYFPGGTVQAKVMDGKMAEAMSFIAAMGHPCAPDFIASDFLAARPEYAWARGLLQNMNTQPWTTFASGMR